MNAWSASASEGKLWSLVTIIYWTFINKEFYVYDGFSSIWYGITSKYYHKTSHWKKNFPKYLEDKKKGASTSGIYVIEVNLAYSAYWVFDIAWGSHIIYYVHRLRRSKALSVGNGARVVALTVWDYSLLLPSGLEE